jgi:hypothetical protein
MKDGKITTSIDLRFSSSRPVLPQDGPMDIQNAKALMDEVPLQHTTNVPDEESVGDEDEVVEPANLTEPLGPQRTQVVVEIPTQSKSANAPAAPVRQLARLGGGKVNMADWHGVDARMVLSRCSLSYL